MQPIIVAVSVTSRVVLPLLLATSGLLAQPAPRPAPEASRLIARLAALAADSMDGRRAGSPGGAKARRWLLAELKSLGVQPAGATFESPFPLGRRSVGADSIGTNLVARIPGKRANGPVLVLSAHYDHVGVRNGLIYNGADDNASGCIALLAIAEQLMRTPPEHEVLLVFFDAEEMGLLGARAFLQSPPVPLSRIALNVNLDMVARQDRGALWIAGTAHTPALRPVAEQAAQSARIPVRFGHDTKDLPRGDDWTQSSDHGPFHSAGIPFLYLGVEDHADYHQPGDDVDKVDPRFYHGVVDFAIQLVQRLNAALPTIRRPAQ